MCVFAGTHVDPSGLSVLTTDSSEQAVKAFDMSADALHSAGPASTTHMPKQKAISTLTLWCRHRAYSNSSVRSTPNPPASSTLYSHSPLFVDPLSSLYPSSYQCHPSPYAFTFLRYKKRKTHR
jgi:hypothetical protein